MRWVHIFIVTGDFEWVSLGANPPLQNYSALVTKNSGLNMNMDIKTGGRESAVGFSKADRVPLYCEIPKHKGCL